MKSKGAIVLLLSAVALQGCAKRPEPQLEKCWKQDAISHSEIHTAGGTHLRLPGPIATITDVDESCKVTRFNISLTYRDGRIEPQRASRREEDVWISAQSRKEGYLPWSKDLRSCPRQAIGLDISEIGVMACLPNKSTISAGKFASAIETGSKIPTGLDYEVIEGHGLTDAARIACSGFTGTYTRKSLPDVELDGTGFCRTYWTWRPDVNLYVDLGDLQFGQHGHPLREMPPILRALQSTLDSWVVSDVR